MDSSLWLHKPNSLPKILSEINQNVQNMLRLIEDDEPESTEKFLSLYQSLGETYNDLNQELLKSLTFGIKVSCSEQNNDSSFKSRKSEEMVVPSLKLNDEVEKNQSAYLIADIFCAELETARRELEARNIEIEGERKRAVDLESKLSDLESELEVSKELLEVSEAEVSKLMEMLNECKTEKAKMQTDYNASGLLDSLRAELRSRDVQIEQMEDYLNQVCVKDTEKSEILSESRTNENVVEEELRARVELLEKQVESQRNVIKEREEEKREAIRQLCFSLDLYMNNISRACKIAFGERKCNALLDK